ncbi:MAG: pilus assembly protein [Aestuariivirgaceae bacterium]|nr:pilus assembly protein [Aestuariivirgaceae bacterium]
MRKLACDSGVAAIEFALIAPAAILLVVMVMEVSMMFIAQSALDKGAAAGSRLLQTGQAQLASLDIPTLFKDNTCGAADNPNRIPWLNCDGQLQVFTEAFDDLANVAIPTYEEGSSGSVMVGGPGDFMVVRLYYPWQFMTPIVSRLVTASGGRIVLSAGAAFRVEDYDQ